MPFAGMIGRALTQAMLKRQMRATAGRALGKTLGKDIAGRYRGAFQSSGKFLFVAHPNCCPKCNMLGMSPHFFNTPDVAFITHPNCKCATVEAPAGLSPAELMEWAKNPVGTMRFGFNYGVSLRPVNLTDANRESAIGSWQNRMDPTLAKVHPRRHVRAKVSQAQVDLIRERVKRGDLGPARDVTKQINGIIKASETRRRKARESLSGKKPSGGLTETAKSRIAQSQKRAVTQKPRKYLGTSTVIPRNSRGTTTELPRNKAQRNFGARKRRSIMRKIGL